MKKATQTKSTKPRLTVDKIRMLSTADLVAVQGGAMSGCGPESCGPTGW